MNKTELLIKLIKWYDMTINPEILIYGIYNRTFKASLSSNFDEVINIESSHLIPNNKKFSTIITRSEYIPKLESVIEYLFENGCIIIEINKEDKTLIKKLKQKKLLIYKYRWGQRNNNLFYICLKSERSIINNHMSLQASIYDSYVSDYSEDIKFLKEWTKDKDEILEVGIGTGRLAFQLAVDKEKYYGIDYSPNMLRILEDKNKSIGLPIFTECQPMQEFNLNMKFDAIIFPFRVLPYCKSKDEVKKVLEITKLHLKDLDSRVLINMINFEEQYILDWNNKQYYEEFINELGFKWTKKDYMLFNKDINIMHREISIINSYNDVIMKTEDNLLWMSSDDLIEICEDIGFKIYNIWPAYNFEEYSQEWEYLLSIGLNEVEDE